MFDVAPIAVVGRLTLGLGNGAALGVVATKRSILLMASDAMR